MSQSNAEQVVYVGSGAGELLGFSMDRATGALRRCGQTRAGECPSFVAFHPERPLAYAIDENAGVVRSFAMSNAGELREIGCVDSGGAGPAYVS
ncbi:MAG TPA: beta-propeller fold lactonase family protein, partial [Polyangiaceae bacterium]